MDPMDDPDNPDDDPDDPDDPDDNPDDPPKLVWPKASGPMDIASILLNLIFTETKSTEVT